jgi:hypothetical protein
MHVFGQSVPQVIALLCRVAALGKVLHHAPGRGESVQVR